MNDVVALGTRNHSDCDRCDEPSRFIYHVPHAVMKNLPCVCDVHVFVQLSQKPFWQDIPEDGQLLERVPIPVTP